MENALFDFGALGVFCAFLIYQHQKMGARLDRLNAEWTQSLENTEKSHAAAERHIRDRYDSILLRYEAARETIFKDIVQTLGENRAQLRSIHAKIEDIRRHTFGIPEDPELTTWADK